MPTSVHYDYNDGNGAAGMAIAFDIRIRPSATFEQRRTQTRARSGNRTRTGITMRAKIELKSELLDHAELHVWESVTHQPVCAFNARLAGTDSRF